MVTVQWLISHSTRSTASIYFGDARCGTWKELQRRQMAAAIASQAPDRGVAKQTVHCFAKREKPFFLLGFSMIWVGKNV
jgi:hypothetical protein